MARLSSSQVELLSVEQHVARLKRKLLKVCMCLSRGACRAFSSAQPLPLTRTAGPSTKLERRFYTPSCTLCSATSYSFLFFLPSSACCSSHLLSSLPLSSPLLSPPKRAPGIQNLQSDFILGPHQSPGRGRQSPLYPRHPPFSSHPSLSLSLHSRFHAPPPLVQTLHHSITCPHYVFNVRK